MKTILLIPVLFLSMTSCVSFEYYSQHFEMTEIVDDEEASKVYHTVAFNAQSGSGKIRVYNMTEEMIEISLDKSFVIVNSEAKTLMSNSTVVNIDTKQRSVKDSRYTYSSKFYSPGYVTYYNPGVSTVASSNGYMRGSLKQMPSTISIPPNTFREIQMPSILESYFCSESNRTRRSKQGFGYTIENTPLLIEVQISSATETLSNSQYYCTAYKEFTKIDSENMYYRLIQNGDCAKPVIEDNTVYYFYK